jgi:two-component system cell cycle sensor histidine kinase PleC
MTLAAIGVALFLALRLGNRVGAPIIALAGATERMGRGDYQHRVQPTGQGEIAVLEHGFNAMADGLEQAHNRLESANRDMELRVAERTRALGQTNRQLLDELQRRSQTEEKLRKAIESAEVASRAKSAFLANMSHELRTPLNAVIGFSEIISRQMFGPVGNPRYADYAEDILSSGQHLLHLINDILDLSRVEAGKMDLVLESVDVGKAVDHVVREVAISVASDDIEVTTMIERNLPEIVCDPVRLRQIMLNLLVNAIKFTPSGGRVAVRIRTRRNPSGQNGGIDLDRVLQLSVIDTGRGIAPADIDKVLQPFGRTDFAVANERSGAGLGLPLTKVMAEMHGGSLTLASRVGRGTNVTVTLPLVAKQPAADQALKVRYGTDIDRSAEYAAASHKNIADRQAI